MLYTEAYVLVLFKGSSHTDRIWFLWFIHKLSSWSVLLLRSAQLPPLTTEQIQHGFSAPTSVVCKSPICNWFIEEQLQVQGASNWHLFCKLSMINFKNTCTSSASISAFTNNTPKIQTVDKSRKEKTQHFSVLLFYVTISSLFPWHIRHYWCDTSLLQSHKTVPTFFASIKNSRRKFKLKKL